MHRRAPLPRRLAAPARGGWAGQHVRGRALVCWHRRGPHVAGCMTIVTRAAPGESVSRLGILGGLARHASCGVRVANLSARPDPGGGSRLFLAASRRREGCAMSSRATWRSPSRICRALERAVWSTALQSGPQRRTSDVSSKRAGRFQVVGRACEHAREICILLKGEIAP